MLQEVIDKTEGAEGAAEEKRELEELKQLLPEIAEKVEDAKESQRTASAASEAIHQTLVSFFFLFYFLMHVYFLSISLKKKWLKVSQTNVRSLFIPGRRIYILWIYN